MDHTQFDRKDPHYDGCVLSVWACPNCVGVLTVGVLMLLKNVHARTLDVHCPISVHTFTATQLVNIL